MTVLSPEELRLASLRKEQESATHRSERPAAESQGRSPRHLPGRAGQEAERQLIGILRDINQGTMEREDLMQRLSDAGSVAIPLSLGVLYLNFLRSPQDAVVDE